MSKRAPDAPIACDIIPIAEPAPRERSMTPEMTTTPTADEYVCETREEEDAEDGADDAPDQGSLGGRFFGGRVIGHSLAEEAEEDDDDGDDVAEDDPAATKHPVSVPCTT
ncbi:hypothetical protein NliqN6_6639 [Naganishia liquefaciens]|uniref:Uncharacterized protein n=1 Tax=Naganishia liquefaciens TaxID=104408 RepID=A0A8H3YJJ6_9TREE|nr:hypothetical protein NliqN6_6639 [Naganishia liquefaciens]